MTKYCNDAVHSLNCKYEPDLIARIKQWFKPKQRIGCKSYPECGGKEEALCETALGVCMHYKPTGILVPYAPNGITTIDGILVLSKYINKKTGHSIECQCSECLKIKIDQNKIKIEDFGAHNKKASESVYLKSTWSIRSIGITKETLKEYKNMKDNPYIYKKFGVGSGLYDIAKYNHKPNFLIKIIAKMKKFIFK